MSCDAMGQYLPELPFLAFTSERTITLEEIDYGNKINKR
jgi:hypothetical protein